MSLLLLSLLAACTTDVGLIATVPADTEPEVEVVEVEADTDAPDDGGGLQEVGDTASPGGDEAHDGDTGPQGELSDTGDTAVDEPPSSYEVVISITADDYVELSVDGELYDLENQDEWEHRDDVELVLTSGTHVVTARVEDSIGVANALLAAVTVDGDVVTATGDGTWQWRPVDDTRSADDPAYSPEGWEQALTCEDQSIWGTYWPAELYELGASWIWSSEDCRELGQAIFQVELELD